MAIRITRNEEGNCITFVGSSNPAYWNACLSAEINENDSERVDIINDIRTANEDTVQYEFYAVRYQDFADRDNNVFTTAQEMVDYVNENANVIGLSSSGKDLTNTDVGFRLDDTHTSIIMDNGFAFGVNTIKAVAGTDGTIHIKAIGTGTPENGTAGDKEHFTHIDHTRVSVNDVAVSGGLSDVVNTLNELFTVGPFQAVVITDPEATVIADVAGVDTTYNLVGSTAVDPVGTAIFTNSSSGNYAGLKTVDTINQAGEYFTFDIQGEGQIGFGLIHTDASYAGGYYTGTATYANPATFAVSNSAHYGYQFSHWFHPTPNGSWTNYGASTGYITGPGWSGWQSKDEWLAGDAVKVKVGIDENGFIAIYTLQDNDTDWIMHARTSYPVQEGAEFHLGIKAQNAAPRVLTTPKVHLRAEAAPTMYFRFVESPDNNYQYPLFATQEEAEYYDKTVQGTETGEATAVVFDDEPTFTTWYKPNHNYTYDGTSVPLGTTFDGQLVNYTEITTLTNAALVPPAFTDTTITVDELSAVNYQLSPVDVGYVTTIGGITNWSLVDGTTLMGTAPEVTGDYNTNPSDTTTVTVYRTNSYGTSTGTLTINITNLTAPATAISGFNHDNTSPSLVDSDTMAAGSVVHMHNAVADGERLIIDRAYVQDEILPALNGPGDKYYIGIPTEPHDFTSLSDSDWDAAIVWEYETATSHTFKFLNDGVVNNNIVVSSMTNAFYDFAIEINGTSAWLIACNVNAINTEPSPADGGSFSNSYEVTNLDASAPHTIHMAATMIADFDTANLSEIATPTTATGLTSWSKALAFDGSNERTQQVSSDSNRIPVKMSGINNNVPAPTTTGNTSADSNSRPWATAIVFTTTTYNDNQHIWNVGEGAGDVDDNIYLRRSTDRKLYFGWGRSGEVNECLIHPDGTAESWSLTPGNWYGIYIASNGTRLGSGHTAAEIAAAFDIRLMGSSQNWATAGYSDTNLSTEANWTAGSFGARMNRQFTGDMTIGGRGANRSFRGKVASFVSTTLRQGVAMPTDAEIAAMITDPKQWLQDYKVSNDFRLPWQGTDAGFNFSLNDGSSAYSTQVWLMGDGVNDSYANMIRNQVNPSDQNYTKLNLISMVSNDIENVTIQGLS